MVGSVDNNSQPVALPPRNDQPQAVQKRSNNDNDRDNQSAAAASDGDSDNRGQSGRRGGIVNITV